MWIGIKFCFEIRDELCSAGIDGGRARYSRVVGSAAIDQGLAGDLGCIRRVKTVIAQEGALKPAFTCLFEQYGCLGIHAAEIDQIRVACEDRGEQGIEISFFFGSFESKSLQSFFFRPFFEELSDSLAVGGFVMNDKDAFLAKSGGEIGADNALNIITAYYTIYFKISAGSDFGVGICGRNIGETGGMIYFRGGYLYP